MTRTFGMLAFSGVLMSVSSLISCKSAPPPPPQPVTAKIVVNVTADANPDAQNRPSPAVIRIYKLKDDDAFKSGDFFAIYDKEQATLAAALSSREEFELSPGDQRALTAELPLDVHFIGVVVAYRDILNAQWRAEAPIPVIPPKKNSKQAVVNVAIKIERARVTAAAQ